MKKGLKTGLFIIVGIIVIIGGTLGYKVYSKYNKIKTNEVTLSDEEIGINEENKSEKHIFNFLFLGVDKEENATDTIMIATIDRDKGELKISSILRDLYIDMGEGNTPKINYAHQYGGPVNTVKVINETFNLDIRDYVMVNFEGLVNIVDAIGGIEIELKEGELSRINGPASVIAKKMNKKTPKTINSPGKYNLSGSQALSYARIRKIDSDFERTDRQRTVINEIMKKVKNMSLSELDKFTDIALENVETSFNFSEIMNVGQEALKLYNKKPKETKIPIEGTYEGHYWDNGAFYFTWDKEKNVEHLKKFIYEE
ncbi:LCP family protein [Clostridium sp.]|uniref:LCP family protein n=1 Tax=Clostridium sp. TaxID=1506 RepID=UPI003463B467